MGWWQQLPRLAKASLVLIGGVGTIVATMSFVQDFINYKSNDAVQATAIAISARQLEVLKEIATAQAETVQSGPTATAIAQRVTLLVGTQEALETQKRQVMTTLTAIMPQPASTPEARRRTETANPTVGTAPTIIPTITPTDRTWKKWVKTNSFPAPANAPHRIFRQGDNLWVAVRWRLYELTPKGEIVAEMDYNQCQGHWTWDGQLLWVVRDRKVYQCNPDSWKEIALFEVELEDIHGVAWDGSALWVIDGDGNLERYDRFGKRLRRLAVPVPGSGWPIDLVWVEGELWVVAVHGSVIRFESSGFEQIGSFDLSQCGSGLAPSEVALFWDRTSLWVADTEQNRIFQCSPAD